MNKANQFLDYLSCLLSKEQELIIKANNKDLKTAQISGLSQVLTQRLEFNESEIKNVASRIKGLMQLESGVGEIVEQKKLKNGLNLNKVRTPIGKIAIVYESRPEVTLDAVCLCIKSGNSVILKGGSEAINTNQVLVDLIQKSLRSVGIGQNAVKFVKDKNKFLRLIKNSKNADLIIARGSYELVKTITKISKIPVLSHNAGGARIYIDKSADLRIARQIIVNSKISRPAACNSLDTILIHEDIDKLFVEKLTSELKSSGVKILQSEWEKEFLELTLNIKRVEGVKDAVEFINKYGKNHSEGIIAQDEKAIELFVNNIDSAAVFINCSTRFHDGFEFGMGAEMGIATGKLHARGPVGLKELTTYRWEVYGNGQTR